MLSLLRRNANAANAIVLLLAIVPPVLRLVDQPFYIDLATRVLVFAIAAVSLDLILGYGGMVSLGHAAYLGIGAYSVGILSFYGVTNGYAQFATAIAASAFASLVVGAVSVRTKGVHFIMISLAFGQMLYYLATGVSLYGGDDGMTVASNSDFGPLDLGDPTTLYYLAYAVLIVVLAVLHRLVRSRFGVVLRAVKSNEVRAVAIGFSPYGFKLLAFVMSGTICGIAGALLANQNLFVSPATMEWQRSGEILIITILGGMGSLSGPVIGSVLYVLLEYFLSRVTDHWQVALGVVIVAVVLLGSGGLFNIVARRWTPKAGKIAAVRP